VPEASRKLSLVELPSRPRAGGEAVGVRPAARAARAYQATETGVSLVQIGPVARGNPARGTTTPRGFAGGPMASFLGSPNWR